MTEEEEEERMGEGDCCCCCWLLAGLLFIALKTEEDTVVGVPGRTEEQKNREIGWVNEEENAKQARVKTLAHTYTTKK